MYHVILSEDLRSFFYFSAEFLFFLGKILELFNIILILMGPYFLEFFNVRNHGSKGKIGRLLKYMIRRPEMLDSNKKPLF
jgi:hypothetical protein